jgi:DNA-binding transcriptional ArsR family regulator
MPRLSRDGTPPVSIDYGPAYEFLMSLVAVADIENQAVVEVGQEWLQQTRSRAGAALMARLAAFSQESGDPFIQLVPLAYDAPARTVSALLDHLAAFDAEELALQLVGYYEYHVRRAASPEVIRAAVEGDRQAREQFVQSCEGWGAWRNFVERALGRDVEATKAELLAILREWHERVWRAEEERLLPILQRDAEAKRVLMRELPFERFIEVTTNGVVFASHAGLERLILVPSYIGRPWVSHAEYRGAELMIYPVADESVTAERDAPPLRLLRLTKALGDEKRLRILRALAAGPRTLAELAEQFEVPKTTMHHHMITLRSAGFVSVSGATKEYRLRHDALPSMADMLGGYLGSQRPEAASDADDSSATGRASRGAGRGRRRQGVAAATPRQDQG